MDQKSIDLTTMYYKFKRLKEEEKFSIQRIADHCGYNYRTVRKYLKMSEDDFLHQVETINRRSCLLDPYKQSIYDYLMQYQDTQAAVLHSKLKEQDPHFPEVHPKTFFNYVMRIRQEFNILKIPRSERQYSPVPELPMGEQAQVDFGEKRLRTTTGDFIKVYFFVMLLCYSRYKYVLFRDKPFTSEAAVEAHEKAFEFFGGIPREVVYDQDAVFMVDENLGEYKCTDVFSKYLAARTFRPYFCRKADPESKGKVENVVRYVKYNFLYNRDYVNLEILNNQVIRWLHVTGNAMVHHTTRKIPCQEYNKEQRYLQPWHPIFNTEKHKDYKVDKTNVIKYHGNIYSLPYGTYQNEDTTVRLEEIDDRLVIKDHCGGVITTHFIPAGKGQKIINNNHRRNPSVKIDQLRSQLQEFFGYSTEIDVFIEKIQDRYPRYRRDQFTLLLNCCEKYGSEKAEKALEYCINNHVFSATDFKYIIEKESVREKSRIRFPLIKPLGGSKTQLMAHIEPERSDIHIYESFFHQQIES